MQARCLSARCKGKGRISFQTRCWCIRPKSLDFGRSWPEFGPDHAESSRRRASFARWGPKFDAEAMLNQQILGACHQAPDVSAASARTRAAFGHMWSKSCRGGAVQGPPAGRAPRVSVPHATSSEVAPHSVESTRLTLPGPSVANCGPLLANIAQPRVDARSLSHSGRRPALARNGRLRASSCSAMSPPLGRHRANGVDSANFGAISIVGPCRPSWPEVGHLRPGSARIRPEPDVFRRRRLGRRCFDILCASSG